MITPVLSNMGNENSSSQQLCRLCNDKEATFNGIWCETCFNNPKFPQQLCKFCNDKQATVNGFWCQSCFNNPPKTCIVCSAKHHTNNVLCKKCTSNLPKKCVHKKIIAVIGSCDCQQKQTDTCVCCNKIIIAGKLACSDENCKLYANYLVQKGELSNEYDLS